MRALSDDSIAAKPGKQFVTFLLIANVSLFFFHTLEGMKSVFGENMNSNRRTRPYASLIFGVAPLIVFYRFHSSVCLAEIWKHCYNIKNRPNPPINLTHITLDSTFKLKSNTNNSVSSVGIDSKCSCYSITGILPNSHHNSNDNINNNKTTQIV